MTPLLSLGSGLSCLDSYSSINKIYPKPKLKMKTVQVGGDLNEQLARKIIEIEEDPAYEIHITGQELAADIIEAMLNNYSGFNHRDAERAIINNLGDLSEEASYFVLQSNLWHNSSELKMAMTELNYAADDFISATKSYKKLSHPGLFSQMFHRLPFLNKEAMKERRLKDLIQSLQMSRHQAKIAINNLNRVMSSFEVLNQNFAVHYVKMKQSIDILQSAISSIRLSSELQEDQQVKAISVLETYLRNVTTSMTTSVFGLNALYMTFTNQDFAIKSRDAQLKVAMDLMLNFGISADVLRTPFYVQESLDINKNVRSIITDIFYSGKTQAEIVQNISFFLNSLPSTLSIDEMLIILKLLPKGTSSRSVSAWTELLTVMSNYKDPNSQIAIFSNDGTPWVEKDQLRSQDIGVIFKLFSLNLNSVRQDTTTSAVDASEFLRFYDYVDDILSTTESFKKDGLNGKFKKSIQGYIKVLAKKKFDEIQTILAKEQGKK